MLTGRNRIRRMRRAAVILRNLYRATDPLVADLGMLAEIARQSSLMAVAIDEGREPDILPAEMLAVARKLLCVTRLSCPLPTDADADRCALLVIAALDRAGRELAAKLEGTVDRIGDAGESFSAAVAEARQIRPGMTIQLLAAIAAAGIDFDTLDGAPLERISAAWAADEAADLAEEHHLATLAAATISAAQFGAPPCAL